MIGSAGDMRVSFPTGSWGDSTDDCVELIFWPVISAVIGLSKTKGGPKRALSKEMTALPCRHGRAACAD